MPTLYPGNIPLREYPTQFLKKPLYQKYVIELKPIYSIAIIIRRGV